LREKSRLRVFENRVFRRIYGLRINEETREWRKLHNNELNDLDSSPNNFRVIKLITNRWAGHVARMGKAGFSWGNLKDVDGKLILSWIIGSGIWGYGLD
jgi:hypothetical protein